MSTEPRTATQDQPVEVSLMTFDGGTLLTVTVYGVAQPFSVQVHRIKPENLAAIRDAITAHLVTIGHEPSPDPS